LLRQASLWTKWRNEDCTNGPVNGEINGEINGQLNGQLNDSQKETLGFMKAHEGFNTTRIAESLGKPFRTVDKHINILLELNLIERRGSKIFNRKK
jgi:ATP-dependent DNA helicase RecG